MKKAYTITFQHVLNYGAVLQAYALAKFLNKNGVETEVIDYRPKYFVYQTYRPRKGIIKTYKKILKNIRFYKFRRDFIPLTSKSFFSVKALEKYFNKNNDYFICGSDQLWNFGLTDGRIDRGYFLDFVPSSAKRISYAASIGNTPFKEADYENINTILSKYANISVREDFAYSQLQKISNNKLNPQIVVDPSLLIDDYSEILDYSLVPDGDYVVSYLTEDSKTVREYIKRFIKMTNLPLINLGHHKIEEAHKNYLYESPSKWLGVFSKATYVCTNSFHGNAYSLIFKRNFTVFSRETKKELNRRQLTLLENLGLENRFIYTIEELSQDHLSPIKYEEEVNAKYNKLIDASKAFLLNIFKQ